MTIHPGAAATALMLACAVLSGCGKEDTAAAPPPPPAVRIVTIAPETLPNIIELPGRIEAVRTAEVRARTNGIVLGRLYEEGTDVRQGQPLFQIDPREIRAQVQQGEAVLSRALAAQANAAAVVTRYRPLLADRSVSGQENDSAVSTLRQAQAQVAEARATLAQNRLQLGFTTVRAPIAGRVGRAEVTEGALVSSTEATLMTRVNQVTPVYAVFTQSNSSILDMVADIRAGKLQIASLQAVEVRLILDNGADYGIVGHLDFTDQSVDPQTGTQTIRAVFPNPQRMLAPGQFVRARITAGTMQGGVAVPERAVQFNGAQASVSVVGPDGTMVARPVQLGAQVPGKWIIQSGLKRGERVVVDGWQKARAGQKVRIQAADGKPVAAPAPAANATGG